MIRRLLNLLTALSLLLCLAVAAAWVCGHAGDPLRFDVAGGRYQLYVQSGWFVLDNEPQRLAEAARWDATKARLFLAREAARVKYQPAMHAYDAARARLPVGSKELMHFARAAYELEVAADSAGNSERRHEATPRIVTPAKSVGVPCALALATFAALPVARLTLRHRRSRRISQGLCPACGYDLTGNVSGVCPECGARARDPQGAYYQARNGTAGC